MDKNDHTLDLTHVKFCTVKQLANSRSHAWLDEAKLRRLIAGAKPRYSASGELLPGNGIDSAIVRVGRKVLIDISRFDEWVIGNVA